MKLLVATTNPGKVREYATLLAGLNVELVGLKDVGILTDVDETGSTYAENAALKARTYAQLSGLLTLADDSGLEVDALGGRPGVYSSRYAPDSSTRIQKLLKELEGVSADRRTARFQCVTALAAPDGRLELTCGTVEGVIAPEPRGNNGFGYDPIFYLPERGMTLAELPAEEKDLISHRGLAAKEMRRILEKIVNAA